MQIPPISGPSPFRHTPPGDAQLINNFLTLYDWMRKNPTDQDAINTLLDFVKENGDKLQLLVQNSQVSASDKGMFPMELGRLLDDLQHISENPENHQAQRDLNNIWGQISKVLNAVAKE